MSARSRYEPWYRSSREENAARGRRPRMILLGDLGVVELEIKPLDLPPRTLEHLDELRRATNEALRRENEMARELNAAWRDVYEIPTPFSAFLEVPKVPLDDLRRCYEQIRGQGGKR